MIFATFVLERDPLRWADLGRSAADWAQDAGGFALCGLIGYGIYRLFVGRVGSGLQPPTDPRGLTILGLLGMAVGYLGYIGLQLPVLLGTMKATLFVRRDAHASHSLGQCPSVLDKTAHVRWACALFVVCLPPLFDAVRLRSRDASGQPPSWASWKPFDAGWFWAVHGPDLGVSLRQALVQISRSKPVRSVSNLR